MITSPCGARNKRSHPMTAHLVDDLDGSGLSRALAGAPVVILSRQVVAGVTYSVTAYVNGGRRPVKFAARYVFDDRRRISAAQSHMALRRATFTSEVER